MTVIGADEVSRAFKMAGTSFLKEKRTRLRGMAEPVRRDAEMLAVARITRIGPEWYRMRTGATPTVAYVAPVERGTNIASRRRRNLARKLLNEAMVPALDKNAAAIERQWDAMVERMERSFSRGR